MAKKMNLQNQLAHLEVCACTLCDGVTCDVMVTIIYCSGLDLQASCASRLQFFVHHKQSHNSMQWVCIGCNSNLTITFCVCSKSSKS